MKVHLIILSIACFSCLLPPAMSHLLAAKLAAVGAVKGAALLGAGALAKGALVKGAALLAAKGAVIKGAAVLGAKAAVVGGAAYLAKKAIHAKAAAVHGLAAKGAAVLAAKAAAVKGAALLAKGAALKGASLLAAKGAAAVGTGLAVKGALANHFYAPNFYKPHLVAVAPAPAPCLDPLPPVPPQFPAVLAERLSGLYDIAAVSVSKQAAAVNELGAVLHHKYATPLAYRK